MANTIATSPGTVVNSSVAGSYANWVNPNNAKSSDNAYVTTSNNFSPIVDVKVSLINSDGSYGSENKQLVAAWPIAANTYYEYGGTTDLWSETITPNNINDVDFGVVFQAGQSSTQINAYTDEIKATNFGFNIPLDATINGVLVEIERNYVDVGRTKTPQIDHIRVTVYYTEPTFNPAFAHRSLLL